MFTRKPTDTVSKPVAAGQSFATAPPRLGAKLELPTKSDGPGRSLSPTPATAAQPQASRDGYVWIGKGTKLIGDIADCTLLEVQGVLEGSVIADAVVIREGGGFKGTLQTDQAEVHGVVEGTIVVHELLDVRGTGQVGGDLTYGRIAVAEGGFIAGSLKTKAAHPEPAHQPPELIAVNGSYVNGGSH